MKTATKKNGITEVLSTPIVYQTKLFKADGMSVLAPEPKGGSRKRARGGGAATKGLKFEGVR